MSKPNVLILISTDIIGGPGKGILQLTGEFHKRKDIDYHIGVFKVKTQKEIQFIEKAEELGRNLKVLTQEGAFDFLVVKRILSIIDNNKINILQTHGYKENIIGFIVTRLRSDLKWVSVVHGWTAENWKMQIYHYLHRISLRFCDTMIAVSEALMSQVKNYRPNAKRNKVILNAIYKKNVEPVSDDSLMPNGFLKTGSKQNPFVWAAIGRLTEDKGHSFLIKAFAKVVEKNPNQRLFLVGRGPQYDVLIRLIEELGLKSSVFVAGYQENVEPFFARTDVMVLPSIAFEGLPNVILEALNFSVPVISTPVTGVSEILVNNENGWLVPIADSNALAKKMLYIINNPSEFERVKANTQKSIFPKFSVKNRVDSFISEYQYLLENREYTTG